MESFESTSTDGSRILVDFPSFKIGCLDLIDLVVFNDNGKASIDLNILEVSNVVIHKIWLERYKRIYKKFNAYGKLIEAYVESKDKLTGDNKTSIEKSINKPDWLEELNLSGISSFNIQSKKFIFNLTRVRHYKEPYSMNLLQKFMLYLSRNGFEHDFTS